MLEKLEKITNSIPLLRFSLIISVLNFVLYHKPFFGFVFENINYRSFHGMFMVISLIILMIVANAFVFYLIFFISQKLGKFLFSILFILNAVCVYFINTYNVMIDAITVSNVLNTNYEEASSFFHYKLILYVFLLGILPSWYIIKVKIVKPRFKRFVVTTSLTLLFMIVMIFANAQNWLWIDKNSKYLGGLAMPWSYTVNTSIHYIHKYQQNKKEILLPNAHIKDTDKAVVILVVGESARSHNFSLYGYPKNTNPLLSATKNVHHFPATSCATYTTAGLKCILEHQSTSDLYEILPNYLFRNDVDVIWRTTNSGEPPIHIEKFQKSEAIREKCQGDGCHYDEVLLTGLKETILQSSKNKILVVLHTSTSHGPTYNKKYPPYFEIFSPVCNSVELSNCTHEELINAYDNTIVYTDYILHKTIETLKELPEYKSTMIYVSDHGESLGEKNLYMHGVPISLAPKEQYEIPFIVWISENSKKIKPLEEELSQHHVFHSVLNFLSVESPVYKEDMNIFQ